MRMLDLCAGIGGFSRAGEWLGIETAGFVEIEPWNRRVLAKYWPNAYYHDDVRTFRKEVVPSEFFDGTIDLVCGGFP